MDKKLTPLIELQQIVKFHKSRQFNPEAKAYNCALEIVLTNIDMLLDKEKQFAEEMYNKGQTDLFHSDPPDFTTFYNQFNQTENGK